MEKSIRFRVPLWLFRQFKVWCDDRNTTMSEELRRHIHGLVAKEGHEI
jgi:hypothetical protein